MISHLIKKYMSDILIKEDMGYYSYHRLLMKRNSNNYFNESDSENDFDEIDENIFKDILTK